VRLDRKLGARTDDSRAHPDIEALGYGDHPPTSLPMNRPLLLLCTCPDADTAALLARTLVEERLAACVNRIDGVSSTYRWNGGIEEDSEHLLLIKTTTRRYTALQDRITELHPYEVPEIIGMNIEHGLNRYLDWLRDAIS
jgi:periplasmic divalent cation tolerance protein